MIKISSLYREVRNHMTSTHFAREGVVECEYRFKGGARVLPSKSMIGLESCSKKLDVALTQSTTASPPLGGEDRVLAKAVSWWRGPLTCTAGSTQLPTGTIRLSAITHQLNFDLPGLWSTRKREEREKVHNRQDGSNSTLPSYCFKFTKKDQTELPTLGRSCNIN